MVRERSLRRYHALQARMHDPKGLACLLEDRAGGSEHLRQRLRHLRYLAERRKFRLQDAGIVRYEKERRAPRISKASGLKGKWGAGQRRAGKGDSRFKAARWHALDALGGIRARFESMAGLWRLSDRFRLEQEAIGWGRVQRKEVIDRIVTETSEEFYAKQLQYRKLDEEVERMVLLAPIDASIPPAAEAIRNRLGRLKKRAGNGSISTWKELQDFMESVKDIGRAVSRWAGHAGWDQLGRSAVSALPESMRTLQAVRDGAIARDIIQQTEVGIRAERGEGTGRKSSGKHER